MELMSMNFLNKKILLFVLLAAMFAAVYKIYLLGDKSESVALWLGDYHLEIPVKNAVSGSLPGWMTELIGLDDSSNSVLVRFDDIAIKEKVSGYKITENEFLDDIEVLLAVLSSEEIIRYTDSQHSAYEDLWYSKNSYENRLVELDENFQWHKVFRKIEYPYSWAYLNQYPDSSRNIPTHPQDFWIAHCLRMGPKNKQSVSCKTHLLINDILVEFDISDYNLEVLNEIKNFLRSNVESWIIEKRNGNQNLTEG